MTWTEAGVILAVCAAGFSLVKEVLNFFHKRNTDRAAVEVAKAQQPEIMRQLEMGNFKIAAEGIAIAQGLQSELLGQAREDLRTARVDIGNLKDRETALEAEAEGWQNRYYELKDMYSQLQSTCGSLETTCDNLQNMVNSLQQQLSDYQRMMGGEA